MGITYNKTVLATGTATGDYGWTNVDSQSANGDRSCPTNSGACIDFTLDSNKDAIIYKNVTSFSLLVYDISVWFFLPKSNSAYIDNGSNAVRIRCYSGSNWAEWYFGGNDTLGGGWMMFLVSGNSPDNSSGTVDYGAITQVALCINSSSSNTDDAPKYSIGEFKRGSKIIVSGYNGGTTPYTFQNIFDTSESNGWGIVKKEDVFVGLSCGLEIGDGTTVSNVTDTNIYVYGDQFSSACDHPIVVKNNATLQLGSKLTGTESDLYAIQGCSFIQKKDYDASFTVDDGGVFKFYGGLLKNWNAITFADDTSEDSLVELIKVEFDNNDSIIFNRTKCEITNIKFHDPQGTTEVAKVNAILDTMQDIKVFNCTDGIKFTVNAVVSNLWAGDNTYDIVALNTVNNLQILNSTFDSDKIKEVTS